MGTEKWDLRFLEVAGLVSSWSKDPSTRVGAVIVNDRRIISTGYNGFDKFSGDVYKDREDKYSRTIHAEENAILFADRRDMQGATMYVTMYPCSLCSAKIVQVGIDRVVTITPTKEHLVRWGDSFKTSKRIFESAGIQVKEYTNEKVINSITGNGSGLSSSSSSLAR